MSDHMDIINEVCGDIGLGMDPLQEARRAAWDLFHAAWTKDANGNWNKSVRIFLLPSRRSEYGSHENQRFWGRDRDFSAYFSINETDCKYLAPLQLQPLLHDTHRGWSSVNTNEQQFIFNAITKKLGIEPQFLNFKDLFLNGIELDMMISNDTYNKQIAATNEKPESVGDYLNNTGRLGDKALNAETKQVKVFLAWVFFGLSIPTSSSVDEVTSAIANGICPPLVGRDVARARHIVSCADDIFGRTGNKCRGQNREGLLAMVATWDAILVSLGVTPPHRAKELRISKIDSK
jgi:hypothetical protein